MVSLIALISASGYANQIASLAIFQLVQEPEKGVKLRQKKHAKKRMAAHKRKFADGTGRLAGKNAKRARLEALVQRLE